MQSMQEDSTEVSRPGIISCNLDESDDSSKSSLFEYEKFAVETSSKPNNEKCGKYSLVQFIASQENERKTKRVNQQDVGVIAKLSRSHPHLTCGNRGAKVEPSVS